MSADPAVPTVDSVEGLRTQIVGIDKQVPLLDGSTQRYINLDNAASTPTFRRVEEKVNEFLGWYSSVHRGFGFKSLLSTRVYEHARKIVAGFVGADLQTNCVIFGKNATEALNKVAHRFPLQPDDVVLCSLGEHHSNDLPWRQRARVHHIAMTNDGSLDEDDLDRLLDRYAGRVKLVAISGGQNVTGWVAPVHRIAERVHASKAKIIVDAAQLAPHRTIDMRPDDEPDHLDFVAFAAHKLYAPYGIGVLVGPAWVFDAGTPDLVGGGTVDIVTAKDVQWASPPGREEAGTPNVVGAVALATSIRLLSEVGMEAIAAHERELTGYTLGRLNRLGGIKIYGSSDPDRLEDRLGNIVFSVEGIPHGKVAAILGFEAGIGVRSGLFCAHPYLLWLLGIGEEQTRMHQQQILKNDWANLPGLVRVSLGCYNTFYEIDHLIEMLQRILHNDYYGDYAQDRATGCFWPRDYDWALVDKRFSL
ncbi:aminotransferase class V-fold PLP-dependent enzyme [Chloroflexota bacterium]